MHTICTRHLNNQITNSESIQPNIYTIQYNRLGKNLLPICVKETGLDTVINYSYHIPSGCNDMYMN